MEGEKQYQKDGVFWESSVLLELSAADDLAGFRFAVEDEGFGVDETSLWYGRKIGSKKMGFEERTPLMIASMYGSTQVLKYIIETGKVDLNRACGSDGATALHCAAAGGSDSSVEVVKLLVDASADVNSVDANGNTPRDLIARGFKLSRRKTLEMMLLKGVSDVEEEALLASVSIDQNSNQEVAQLPKKEYPVDVSLPDINNGVYGTDEFRMYSFKVKPCSRAYSHDWTECPFVHPGENARRRDPTKYHYSCVPCPEFRKGNCAKADACEYAHGVFESWLHPAQYRTRLCKDETGCSRKVCFFAHKHEELRPLSSAFAKRSQSFIDRGAVNHRPGSLGLTAAANSASLMSSHLSDWSSPDGKLDWGFHGEEQNKLKKSASFGFRSGNAPTTKSAMRPSALDEPDVSWVNSLVKDVSSVGAGLYSTTEQKHGGLNETLPPWVEQLYIEQEQMVA
ncbi:Zinc finger CCCH domain-containing protein 66 [Camellia lanceoleosa]|uniref:Zinc finger CCCH domain-containing protein 66 n=1 Tax=Camellia lanceoleosa TaxID=1840588 RepID=A0ACC0H1S2_9ERIC|nr:Zinc finger CCCH domain-containing protein 66 [Camellia lanceoleosa]